MKTLNRERRFHKIDAFLIKYKAKIVLKIISRDAFGRQFDTRMNTSSK